MVRLDQLHKILQRNDSPVDERRAVDIVYLAFTKAAGTVSPMIIIHEMLLYRLNEQRVRWNVNVLNGQAPRVLISDTKSS